MRDRPAAHMRLKEGISYILRGYGIVRYMFPSWFAVSTMLGVLRALQPLAAVFFSARVIEALTAQDYRQALSYAILTVSIAVMLHITASAAEKRMRVMQEMIWERNRLYRGKKFAEMSYDNLESRVVNELNAQIDMMENTHGLGIVRIFSQHSGLVQAIVGTVVSIQMFSGLFYAQPAGNSAFIASSWPLMLLVLSFALTILLRTRLMRWSMRVMARIHELLPVSNATGGYYQQYVEAERAGKDLRIYGQKDAILAILKKALSAWLPTMSRMESLVAGLTAASNAAVTGLAYLLIGLRALSNMYSIGQVTQYVGAITTFSSSVTILISTFASIWENAAYLPVLYALLDLPNQTSQDTTHPIAKQNDVKYEIEFHDVSFRYPDSEQWALHHLNIKIKAGERVAVVGRNGSGKTTMIKLLCRLYLPTKGHITLNGVDIRQVEYDDYFSLLAVVFQDFMLPSLPLGQVVASKTKYDERRVCNALERVGFPLDRAHFSQALETYIGRDYDASGVMLSGGEAQKIALARAIYKDAPLVVLDEPTAALDPIAEAEIYSRFNLITGGKTTLFISHRLSSCRFCNEILVFEQGKLVQRGAHDELMRDTDGLYHQLWTSQAQHYQTDG